MPRPVQPKSQTQRIATANPSTEGMAASHRQRAAPAVSTLKPSQPGSSQNHNAKKPAPTRMEATAVSHFPVADEVDGLIPLSWLPLRKRLWETGCTPGRTILSHYAPISPKIQKDDKMPVHKFAPL